MPAVSPVPLMPSAATDATRITEQVFATARHTTFYLAAGDSDAPLVVFVHGWPELSHSWRHQLPFAAARGLRAVAPDMRGYGRSTVHPAPADYALERIVADMLELLDGLGRRDAVWVGHDWGSQVVWALAAHHPERCRGVASLCVPYLPNGTSAAAYVDRAIYPADRYPLGQWDYFAFYQEQFEKACADFEADVEATLRCLFRRGDPGGAGKPAPTASVRANGGWFGGAGVAPNLPRDPAVLDAGDLAVYADALRRNGFAAPCAWYLNGRANVDYGRQSLDGGRLGMPVLFLHGAYDYTCQTVTGTVVEPMRAHCRDLAEKVLGTGHWMAQEDPGGVNDALGAWLDAKRLGASAS
jgi:pimeloyl-ACP methyl ester carboxylesterase